jgi:cell division protein FtsI (penicillin-binding protein 3)
VTYGAALEENLISPADMLDCGQGFIETGGRRFQDKHCVKSISYTEAMAVSSNIGAIKTGLRLGKDRFYNYMRIFGFGEPTGIELPAEARGQLRAPEGWNGDSLPSMSIGYEIGVTALQTAVSFATIANDGVRVKPHIIKEIRQADGKVIFATEPEKTRVVSAETARSLRHMLQSVVLKGTGKRAQLNGYSSAGKTGTAWKYDAKLKRINENKYVSSFVGMASVKDPAVVIAVVLDEPSGAGRDGGQVSAPIFHDIAEQILPELNVAPDGGGGAAANLQTAAAQEIDEPETKPIAAKSGQDKTVVKDGKKATEKSNIKEKLASTEKRQEPKRQPGKSTKEEEDSGKSKLISAGEKPKGNTKNKSSTIGARNKT